MQIFPNHILVAKPTIKKYPTDVAYSALRSTVANALVKAGLIPVVVGPEMDQEAALWLYEQCAGVVFTGGADWNPTTYHQARAKETQPSDDARDSLEQLLLA